MRSPAECWLCISSCWHWQQCQFSPKYLQQTPRRSPSQAIDPSHKSHNASDRYPTMYHFVTEMCTRAHFCYKMVHCGIWDWRIVGFVQQVHWLSSKLLSNLFSCFVILYTVSYHMDVCFLSKGFKLAMICQNWWGLRSKKHRVDSCLVLAYYNMFTGKALCHLQIYES